MLNSLDPDQARRFVGLDLGPNCLQWLHVLADSASRDQVNAAVPELAVFTNAVNINPMKTHSPVV